MSSERKSIGRSRKVSPRNLKCMRTFTAVWANRHFVQQVAAQIP